MNDLSLADAVCLAVAGSLAYGYFCRLNALHLGQHRLDVVAFHLFGFGGCFWAGVDAYHGRFSVTHFCFLCACGLWLLISLPTWRHGPPEHVVTDWGRLDSRPGELIE